MAGININNLPQNLQQKLSPYLAIAKDIDSAIDMARQAGKWSDADDKAYNALNGSKAWGQFDGFEKSDLAKEIKSDPLNAFTNVAKAALAEDAQKNPDKYRARRYDRESGRYIVYQKDVNTGKDTYKYYDKNGKQMDEMKFKVAEGILEVKYVKGDELALPGKNGVSLGRDKEYIASHKGQLLTQELSDREVQNAGFIFTSCAKDDVTEYNFSIETKNVINVTFDTASLTSAMVQSLDLQARIASLLEQINNNTSKTNEEIAALKDEVKQLKAQLEEINKKLLTIITNQEVFAQSSDEYFKRILDVIGGNQDLLKFIVGQLTESNDTLKQIKELMEKSNANQIEILEAVTKCKYGIETLHEDNKDIKALLSQINDAIAHLPEALKSKFEGYFKSIILGIADNGAKLGALTNLLRVVNANMVAGHTAILDKLDKMQAVIEAFASRTNVALGAIATAIANIAAKVDTFDFDKLLEAINKLDADMVAQFEYLAEIGKKNNELTEKSNAVLEEILKAIQNFKPEIQVDLTELINTVKQASSNLTVKLEKIFSLLSSVNDNVEAGNKDNKELLTKILQAIIKKQDPDFSAIINKLDEILNAIKDHKVTVDVTGKITVNCNCGSNHEGIIEDLDWILG